MPFSQRSLALIAAFVAVAVSAEALAARKKKPAPAASPSAAVAAAPSGGSSGTKLSPRSLLDGIGDSFYLMIARDQGAEDSGLMAPEFQKRLRDHFKEDGVILTDLARMPMVVLAFSANPIQSDKEGDYYSLSVQLQVKEATMTVGRTRNISTAATTWSRDVHGVFRKNELRYVSAWVLALIDVFATEYNSANKMFLSPGKSSSN